ncbi:MAG: Mu-like prophage major head subunit gpT family protein [Alistipes sp.]|nr:Mu-like prophage major head subunit gpT family protein [Alistipes sp.]
MAKTVSREIAPQYAMRALVKPGSVDLENREFDVVFATERPVLRYSWEFGGDYEEVLVCEESAVRKERIDRGLPVMDCHTIYSVFKQLGRTVNVGFEEGQLCARVKLSERFADLMKDIAEGIIKDISVGYIIYKAERTDREGMPTLIRVIDWMPTEISFAPVQADIGSEVRTNGAKNKVEITNIRTSKTYRMITKGKRTEAGKIANYTAEEPVKKGDTIELEDGTTAVALEDGDKGDEIEVAIIESSDPEPDDLDERVEKAVEKALAAQKSKSEGKEDDEEGERTIRQRMADIRKSTRAAGLDDTVAIDLFESQKTVEECRQAVIEKVVEQQGRNFGGANPVKVPGGWKGQDGKRDAMTAALLHRTQPGTFKLTDDARQFRGMTLVELGKELLSDAGVSTRGMEKMEVAKLMLSRTHGSGDFPLLLEDVMHKMLRADYPFAPEFWDKISRQTTVADFRPKNFYQVDSKNGMTLTPEGGEVKYTTMKEGKQSIQVKSFSEGIIFTRQAIVNDDLGAFGIIPSRFVNDWNQLRGDLVWNMLIKNVAMEDKKNLFHEDHGNLIDLALSEEAIAAGKVLMSKQTGITGRLLRILPKFLIVSPENEVKAKKLLTAITPARTEDVNVFAQEFTIIVEPRLTNPAEWYLSADPQAVDTLYHAYLEGNENLRVNREEDFDTDSVKFAVRGDFGAAAIDHRGLVKSTGTK